MTHFPILSKESVNQCESDYLRITGLDKGSLLELTGFACAKEILEHYGPFSSDHVVVYVGPGKNGSDGIATALFLAPHTKKISICMPVQPLHDIININMNRIKTFYPNIEFTNTHVAGDIYIDALFGTELEKKPDSIFEQLIKTLNQQPDPIISIDIPSGIDANTSASLCEAVQPDLTLAIWCLKPIHCHEKARMICGEIACLDVGLPHEFVEKYAENQKVAC